MEPAPWGKVPAQVAAEEAVTGSSRLAEAEELSAPTSEKDPDQVWDAAAKAKVNADCKVQDSWILPNKNHSLLFDLKCQTAFEIFFALTAGNAGAVS